MSELNSLIQGLDERSKKIKTVDWYLIKKEIDDINKNLYSIIENGYQLKEKDLEQIYR